MCDSGAEIWGLWGYVRKKNDSCDHLHISSTQLCGQAQARWQSVGSPGLLCSHRLSWSGCLWRLGLCCVSGVGLMKDVVLCWDYLWLCYSGSVWGGSMVGYSLLGPDWCSCAVCCAVTVCVWVSRDLAGWDGASKGRAAATAAPVWPLRAAGCWATHSPKPPSTLPRGAPSHHQSGTER